MLSADQKGKGSGIRTVQVVHARAEKMLPAEKIPLLPFRFFPSVLRLRTKGDGIADPEPEAMLAAPKTVVPESCLHNLSSRERRSISPLSLDGYIIAIDTCETAHDDLSGKILVAWTREKGLLVSRLVRSGASSAECCARPGSQADNRRQPPFLHPTKRRLNATNKTYNLSCIHNFLCSSIPFLTAAIICHLGRKAGRHAPDHSRCTTICLCGSRCAGCASLAGDAHSPVGGDKSLPHSLGGGCVCSLVLRGSTRRRHDDP